MGARPSESDCLRPEARTEPGEGEALTAQSPQWVAFTDGRISQGGGIMRGPAEAGPSGGKATFSSEPPPASTLDATCPHGHGFAACPLGHGFHSASHSAFYSFLHSSILSNWSWYV